MKTSIKKRFVVIGTFCLFITSAFAQDVHFSQPEYAPLLLNPGLAGANYANQAGLIYRDQWKRSDAQFTTINAGYDMRINDKGHGKGFMAGGINFYNDKAGDPKLTTNYVSLSLGYHARLDKHSTFGGALQPSFGQRSLNASSLTWGAQYDGSAYNSALPTGEVLTPNQFSFFDFNAGLVYTYKSSEHYMTANDALNLNIGFAAYHIAQPKYSFYGNSSEKLYRKYVFFANSLIGVPNSKLSFVPSLNVNIQGPQKEFLMGTYFRYLLQDKSVYTGIKKGSAFSMGTFYRAGDAFVAKLLLEYSHFSIGFAYDINLSSYTNASKGRGGFELTLRFVSPNPFGSHGAKSRI